MSIYDTLNEQQKKGVFTIKGPVLLLAGAGSGKTRVLTHRIAYLIEELGVNPWNIMAITFTNKAAGEMKERVETLVGMGSESIWVTTFHSTCVRILRRYADRLGYDNHFTIYDTDDQKSVMKDICKRLKIDTKLLKERSILAAISSAKDELISPKEYELNAMGDFRKQKIAQAYNEYQEALRKSNAMDFDDLIVKTVELFKADREVLDGYQKRFKYIMVDEYQDTNTAQFELVRLLADASHNLCVVGDDDQSIYKFRGANIRNILDFEKVYPEAAVIRLEQNYRSTKNVLDAANAVIRNNKGRKSKTLWTDKKDGSLIHFRQFDQAYEEAEFIADDVVRKKRDGIADYGDCAVLYRTNAQARLLEERFVVEGIPYNVVGGTNFYARREIKDLLAYLKTIDNGRDDLAVKRIINVPRRGIGAATIAKVQDYADIREMSFYDALCQVEDVPGIGKSASKLDSFVTMIQGFRSKVEYYGLEGLIKDVIETTGYVSELEASDDEDAENRIENIDELISKVVAFETEHDEPTLGEFLEEVALVADIDNVESGNNKVLLMTLHSAKGLEFPHIYLAGMEDGIFPGYMTIASDDPGDMEEERRLAYVGITRAKEDLTLSCARMRMIRGETQMNAVSRFVREIPQELMDNRAPVSRFKTMAEGEDEYEPAGNRESLYRPVAALKPRRTAVENKPFIAGGGLGSLAAAGISKGVGAVTGGKPDYDIGDRVKHVKYGEGTVTDLEPGPRDYKVTVDFDDAGKKIMYAAFARLIRL
ncbi:MAG: UvrD-helicase domain-containing protein [Lachnospiraceae bacterium]|jgi:DNA helicase-2/ATP-dependent DNA helicase PcrA|uniref:ATP-dependent helicase n=1 Tax=Parablautia intestinalis TaxID=2320100 RepID=UPI00256EA385|nr:UvrD-helicase domain-containing protein [Parablautia intestinalis]MCI8616575.1 UvrD-helicase domain-containing protein [Lachnospiraceae bacterium]